MHNKLFRLGLLATVSTIALAPITPSIPVDGGTLQVKDNAAFAGGEGGEGGPIVIDGTVDYPWADVDVQVLYGGPGHGHEGAEGGEGGEWGEWGEGGEGGHAVTHGAVVHPWADVDVHPPPAAATGGSKQLGGALLGAAAGGFIGSQIGKGTGQLAAVAAGTLLGAFIGSEVGKSLDRADQLYAEQTALHSLERAPTGTTSSWVNPDSGHSGAFTPVRTYQTAGGAYCREYQQTVTIGGKTEQAYGTACRQPDGNWKLVN